MSTVFILHGGGTSRDTPDNALFFKEMSSSVKKEKIKILLCYWSRSKEEWDMLFLRDKTKISRETNKQIEFIIVNNPEDLFEQLASADILYVVGGHAHLIEPFLSKLSDLKEALQGKVYAGSSMGAFIVSRNYVLSLSSQDENNAHRGLGIIPINTLCHWNVEKKKEKKIAILKKDDPLTPILLLNEEKFSVFVQ